MTRRNKNYNQRHDSSCICCCLPYICLFSAGEKILQGIFLGTLFVFIKIGECLTIVTNKCRKKVQIQSEI